MPTPVKFEKKTIVIKKHTEEILQILGNGKKGIDGINPDVELGRIKPRDPVVFTGKINALKASLEAVFNVKMGAHHREWDAFEVYLDGSANAVYEEFVQFLGELIHKAFSKKGADERTTAKNIESRFVLIYEILCRLAAISLSNSMLPGAYGENVLESLRLFSKEISEDKEDLLDRGLFSKDSRPFREHLENNMPRWINTFGSVIAGVKILYATANAFTQTLRNLGDLERRSQRLLCAKLDPGLEMGEYADRNLENTLKACENKFIKQDKSKMPEHSQKWLATVPSQQLLAQATATEKQQLEVIAAFEEKIDKEDLYKIYSILNETKRIAAYMRDLDDIIIAVNWAAILSGAINVVPIVKLLEAHWNRCRGFFEQFKNPHPISKSNKVLDAFLRYSVLNGSADENCSFEMLSALADDRIRRLIKEKIQTTIKRVLEHQKTFNGETVFDPLVPGRAKLTTALMPAQSAPMLMHPVRAPSTNNLPGGRNVAGLITSSQSATTQPESGIRIEEMPNDDSPPASISAKGYVRPFVFVPLDAKEDKDITISWNYCKLKQMSCHDPVLKDLMVNNNYSELLKQLKRYSKSESQIDQADFFKNHLKRYEKLNKELMRLQTKKNSNGILSFLVDLSVELADRQIYLFECFDTIMSDDDKKKHRKALSKLLKTAGKGWEDEEDELFQGKQQIYLWGVKLGKNPKLRPEPEPAVSLTSSAAPLAVLDAPLANQESQQALVSGSLSQHSAEYLEAKKSWYKVQIAKFLLFKELKKYIQGHNVLALNKLLGKAIWNKKNQRKFHALYQSLYDEFMRQRRAARMAILDFATEHLASQQLEREFITVPTTPMELRSLLDECITQWSLKTGAIDKIKAELIKDFQSLFSANEFYLIFSENSENNEEVYKKHRDPRIAQCSALIEAMKLDYDSSLARLVDEIVVIFKKDKDENEKQKEIAILKQKLVGQDEVKEAKSQARSGAAHLDDKRDLCELMDTFQSHLDSWKEQETADYEKAVQHVDSYLTPGFNADGREFKISEEDKDDLIKKALCCPLSEVPLSYLQDDDGNTLMHYAMEQYKKVDTKDDEDRCIKIIELLYKNGADAVTTNKKNPHQDPYDFAGFTKMEQVKEMGDDENRKMWKLKVLETKYIFSWSPLTKRARDGLLKYMTDRAKDIEDNGLWLQIKRVFGAKMSTHTRLFDANTLLRRIDETHPALDEVTLLEHLGSSNIDKGFFPSQLKKLTATLNCASQSSALIRMSSTHSKLEESQRREEKARRELAAAQLSAKKAQEKAENDRREKEIALKRIADEEKARRAEEIARKAEEVARKAEEVARKAAEEELEAAEEELEAANERAAETEQENAKLRRELESYKREHPSPGRR